MMSKKISINHERRFADLTGISKAINPLLRQLLGNNGMLFMELLNSWENIVGKDVSAYSLPRNISFRKNERTNGCLEIIVLAGAFAMEIGQKQQNIIEKINSFFGYPAIGRLKINQTGNPENFLLSKKPFEKVKKRVVSAEEESYITELTRDINNEELRQSLENIGRAVFSERKNQE